MQVEEQSYTLETFNVDERCDKNNEDNLHSCVKKAIQAIIKEEHYSSYKKRVKPIIPDGGNYLASLYEIGITGETDDGVKEINLFVKQAVPADNLHGFLDIDRAYLKEVFFYTELSNIFDTLQSKANVPAEFRFKYVKCFKQSGTQAIIMENLAKKDFKVPYRMDIMPMKFAESSAKELAKFHALSFVIEKEMPEYYKNTIENEKTVLNFNDKYVEIAKNCFEMTVKYFDAGLGEVFVCDFPHLIKMFPRYVSDTLATVNCLCHGDYRMNNILAKEENGEITVIPIDYQLLFYGSPVTDLIYLLYSSADSEFRKNHERHIKDIYRRTMDEFLKYFDIDMEKVFPTEVFERDFERMRGLGFYVTLVLLPICYSDESNVVEPGSDLINKTIHVDKRFQERVAGVCEEYIKYKENYVNA